MPEKNINESLPQQNRATGFSFSLSLMCRPLSRHTVTHMFLCVMCLPTLTNLHQKKGPTSEQKSGWWSIQSTALILTWWCLWCRCILRKIGSSVDDCKVSGVLKGVSTVEGLYRTFLIFAWLKQASWSLNREDDYYYHSRSVCWILTPIFLINIWFFPINPAASFTRSMNPSI